MYRVDQDQVVAVKSAPGWIAGFEGTSTQEAIGSLVARIDGRDVPLTVGFHTVTVDIRDQIARHRDRRVVCEPHADPVGRRVLLPAARRRVDLGVWHVDR